MTAVEDRRGSTRAAGIVGMAILSSRLLGLIREMVFAGLFGAGRNLDAFLMAFRLPNLLRDLFAEGALSTAFITTFSKKIAVEGDESAWRLANKVATLTAVFMSMVTLLGIVFAPQLVDLLTWWSWSPDKTALTILLARIMWPFMLLVSLAALVMGGAQSQQDFGAAIGTVTLPLVSKSAAVGNVDEFRAILARGIRLAFLLTIPSAIGLAMFASPIISVIYQHGRFNEQMTRETAGALEFYAVGLVSYAVLKVLTPAFYAIGKRNTPMIISFFAIGANLFLNWFFTFRLGWGHRGLAFSTSLVATINFLFLYALMQRHVRRLETRQLLIGLGKMCLAGAVLGLVCWAANYWWLGAWYQLRFFPKLCELLVAIAIGAAAFFA